MKPRKTLAGILALVCSASALTAAPLILPTYAMETAVSDSFDANYDGWVSTSDATTLTAAEESGYESARAMLLSNRQTSEDGVISEKGFYLDGGENYTYHMWVKGTVDDTFHLALRWLDPETNEYGSKMIAEQSVAAGEWTEIVTDAVAPDGTVNLTLTLTSDSTADFYFDEFSVTHEVAVNASKVSAATAEKGLKDEFAPYFRVGNILNGGTVNNSTITASIIKDYNSIECENETKPDATIVQSGSTNTDVKVSLRSAAAIFDFCIKNNIGVRGHTLVWHSQTPGWFFKENFQYSGAWVSKSVMDQRMESYIKNLFAAIKTQYPKLNLYAYDVANECMRDPGDGRTGPRDAGDSDQHSPTFKEGGTSAWVSVYGDNSFIEKAFTYARKYAPAGCQLYYNDYNEYWDPKRDAIYALCKDLYQKKLLDGVGMQSHVPANATNFAGTDSYITAMKKYLSIGCDVHISELDISKENGTYSDQDQANKYKAIFQAAMDWNKNPQSTGRVKLVAIWGPNDANSWLSAGSDALLYDKNHQPKLAYTTLTSMIPQSQWGDGTQYNDSGSTTPTPDEPNQYGWYFADGFEDDLCGWEPRGNVNILHSGRTNFVGSESLLVMDRTASWNGAQKALSTVTFQPGKEYAFSVNTEFLDATEEKVTFNLTLQYNGTDGKTHYVNIANKEVYKGSFAQLYNANFQIPTDVASDMYLVVETANIGDDATTMNFYIDEAIAAVAGTGIVGAEEQNPGTDNPGTDNPGTDNPGTDNPGTETVLLGDANGDGVINVFDLVKVKSMLHKDGGYNKAADVDQSGKVDLTDAVLLQKYLLHIITKFPVAEKPMLAIDRTKMDALFSGITVASSLKKETENNPLFSQRFGADPGVMEYNGRIYVYTTNDLVEFKDGSYHDGGTASYDKSKNSNVAENGYGKIQQINVISSDDMVNWTDHGIIQVAGANGAAKWANNSWAPCAAHKTINGKEKFFLYCCNGGNGIIVLTSDSPTGPWSDPLGKALVDRSVPNCNNIPWLFDPAVFVDKDGTGYLTFGGGVPEGKDAMPSTSRVVKLSADMIHLDGTPVTIDAPYIFEDSGINRIGDKYYYTYCSNWNTGGNQYGLTSGAIEYMVADSPLGPYTYGGELFKNQGTFFGYYGNNHHSICELNGQLYLFYHSRSIEDALGINAATAGKANYRTPQVDRITMNGTKMNAVKGTMSAIEQTQKVNPYSKVQAETMSNQAGINVKGLGDTVVNEVNKGDWIKVSGVNFTNGAKSITVKASSNTGAAIKICTGSPTGTAIGYVDLSQSNGQEVTFAVDSVVGTKDLYFVFSDSLEFDYWYFS